MPRETGTIPSPADYRDKLAAQAVYDELSAQLAGATLPESFRVDLSALKELLDQNLIPACVSHAWALVMKYWWWKKTGEIVNFSPRFLDILSSEPWIPFDGGRVPRTVAKVSAKFGCCTTALLPNDTEKKPGETTEQAIRRYRGATITQAMYDEAAKYKIPGYIRVPDNRPEDFRTAIHQLGLVSGLFAISDAFWKPSWAPKDILPLRTPNPSTSNHQMVVVGWEGKFNWLRNSWSKLWGKDGEGNYDAKDWLPHIFEGWAIATVPADLKAWLSSLPPQANFHYQWLKDLKRGQQNDDIKFAQVGLMILGHLELVKPEELGIYGPKTSKAVLRYQQAKGIYPTAPDSIGPKTRAALNKDFAL